MGEKTQLGQEEKDMPVKSVSASGLSADPPALPVIRKPVSQKLSRSEVLIAGALVLAAYTALLIRMPYRAPVVNGLYTALALCSFYFYLRFRLNIRLPAQLLLCLVVSVVLDIIGNQYNLFSRTFGFLPYDVITHFTASGLSLAAIMWLLLKLTNRFDYHLPLGFVAFFSVTTTFSLSAYYEILELVDEQFFGGHRIWTTHDTVHDLASDLGGVVLAAIIYTVAIRKRWRPAISAANSSEPVGSHRAGNFKP